MKYRIVSNDLYWKVQIQIFFFWEDFAICDSLNDAQDVIHHRMAKDVLYKGPWKVVSNVDK